MMCPIDSISEYKVYQEASPIKNSKDLGNAELVDKTERFIAFVFYRAYDYKNFVCI